jgi:hypothetical protein
MEDESIATRFLEAKAVNFEAIGRLVSDLGPELATSRLKPKLVLIGRPFIIACLMPPDPIGGINRLQGSELAREVLGE